MHQMNAGEMRSHLRELGSRLKAKGIQGEILLAGGAVMVLVVKSRDSSVDIDAVFVHAGVEIRAIAAEMARDLGLAPSWINDHVKVFIGKKAPTVVLYRLPGLTVSMVSLEYMFYLKAWADDPKDFSDLRALARRLGLRNEAEAYRIVAKFSDGALPGNVQLRLEALFERPR